MAECEDPAEKRRRKSSVHVERYFPEPRKRRRHSMHRESVQPVASGRDSGKKKKHLNMTKQSIYPIITLVEAGLISPFTARIPV